MPSIWEQKESIILDLINSCHKAGEIFTSEFPKNEKLIEVIKDKYKVIEPDIINKIQDHLENTYIHYFVKWIKEEFENSSGALKLSKEEFTEYFQLEKGLATTIITKMLNSNSFVLEKSNNNDSTEIIERLQIDPKLTRNYWIKSKLVAKEAESLIEIGMLLRTAFNVRIQHLFMKNRHLVTLDLREQKLDKIPECIGNFQHLTNLNLQSNLIESLPETIGNLKNLKCLDLDNTNIKTLPKSIGNLKNLEELWVRSNKVLTIPDSVGELKNLKRIAFNELPSFPKGLYKLESLKHLNARNNPTEIINDLKKAYPDVHFPIPYVKEISTRLPLRAKENIPNGDFFLTDDDLIHILKPQYYQIFVLGNKGVGKTSLLRGFNNDMDRNETPTLGEIQVKRHEIKDLHLYEGVDQNLLAITPVEVGKDKKEYEHRELTLNDMLVNLADDKNCFEYWEIEEGELYTQLEVAFFQGCDGIIICVDLTDRESIDKLILSLDLFITQIEIVDKELINKIPILVVGTKEDKKNSHVKPLILSLCEVFETAGVNLVSYDPTSTNSTKLMFFCDYNKPRQEIISPTPKKWISTSTKTGKNISLAFKIIEVATKEQQRVNDIKRMFKNKGEKKYDDEGFTPFPFIYSYPKGPPSGSGHALSKKVICPNCKKIIDFLNGSCLYCGFKRTYGF